MIKQNEISIKHFNVFYSNFEVNKETKCWEYSKIDGRGYGYINAQGRMEGAHRFSYVLHKGDFKKELHVRHKCDNPSCVNPDHLLTGSHLDNMKDMTDRDRHNNQNTVKTYCIRDTNYQRTEGVKHVYPSSAESGTRTI